MWHFSLPVARDYTTSVINYQMSDSFGEKLRIIVQPFWKTAADRLFLSVISIYKNFLVKLE